MRKPKLKEHNEAPVWMTSTGKKVACTEKIKVMQQNIQELQQLAQDAFEDGILMGIDETQLIEYLVKLMHNLHNPYTKSM